MHIPNAAHSHPIGLLCQKSVEINFSVFYDFNTQIMIMGSGILVYNL